MSEDLINLEDLKTDIIDNIKLFFECDTFEEKSIIKQTLFEQMTLYTIMEVYQEGSSAMMKENKMKNNWLED